MKISGNTILITGGSGGIGFEFARQLVAKGNTVIITGRDSGRLDKAKEKLSKIHTKVSDVSDPESISQLYRDVTNEFPDLNIVINNAGFMRKVNLQDSEVGLSDICGEVESNLNGVIRMSEQFIPHLKTKKSAALVNISSGLAFVPLPISPVYCATKAAVHSFTVSTRIQLNKTSIQVFEVAPPATQTDLMSIFDSHDMAGVKLMPVNAMVMEALAGIEKDIPEICPGQAKLLRFMSRFFPQFILKQMSKSVDLMHAKPSVKTTV